MMHAIFNFVIIVWSFSNENMIIISAYVNRKSNIIN